MERIALVSGGSGFIGGHLAERLSAQGWVCRVLDTRAPELEVPVHWIEGDVRDRSMFTAAATGAEVIFHLGAQVGVERLLADPLENIDVTVSGTQSALEAAATSGAALVHVSTSEVLGTNADVPWSEDASRVLGSALTDRWAYGSAKATAEHIVLAGSRMRGVDATVVRPFNIYGPRQEPRFVVPRMIIAALDGAKLEVHGTGLQTRCFTYVHDMVDALILVGSRAGAVPLLHVGSTDEIAISDLASEIQRIVGSTAGSVYTKPEDQWGGRFQDVWRRVPDCTLAEQIFGWTATTPLQVGLKATFESVLASRDKRAGEPLM